MLPPNRDLTTHAYTHHRPPSRSGLGRLRNLDPKPPVQGYERQIPADLIHIDVQKLVSFRRVGRRITGNRQKGCSPGVGDELVHVAIDNATRLAYVEVLAYGPAGHGNRLLKPGSGLVQRPERGMPAGDVGQRARLSLTQLGQGLWRPCAQAHQHRALHATHQRHGRAFYPDLVPRMGLLDVLPALRGTEALAAPVPLDL